LREVEQIKCIQRDVRDQVIFFKLLHFCFIRDRTFEMCSFTVEILRLEHERRGGTEPHR